MRMKFYIQGIRRRGTVNLEVQEVSFCLCIYLPLNVTDLLMQLQDKSGNYVYRYLYVLVDDIMQSTIKIADNRDEARTYSNETEYGLN